LSRDETEPVDQVVIGADGVPRCWWSASDPLYISYHDDEWGFPVGDDNRLFEKLCLEGFQAGLSWLTILRKRDNFRRAFAGFDIGTVARFGPVEVERLLGDAGIVRHRGKIESTINNAARALEIAEEQGSLGAYVWSFEGADPKKLSADLKRRGWSFVGPTTVFSFMQAMGLVNDHVAGCDGRTRVEAARASFVRPCRT